MGIGIEMGGAFTGKKNQLDSNQPKRSNKMRVSPGKQKWKLKHWELES
jgi:hypothetical protein